MSVSLVTGGTGYVAGHLINLLLDEGHVVHATVRSLKDAKKVSGLLALQQANAGRLKLFEADLLLDGSFKQAMQGCDVVYHVASPFLLPEQIKNPRDDLLTPALHGTRNVLGSVDEVGTVRRVVLTSTVGAIFGDYSDVLQMDHQTLSERYFNTSSSLSRNPYHFSKVMAEQEAWAICGRQSRWQMVSINPGLVLGPTSSPASASGSLFLLDELFRGLFFYGVPDFSFTYADVRDVALAHLRAGENPAAAGRYIVAEKTMVSFLDMAMTVRRFHDRAWLIPRRSTPNWAVKLLGPLFGLSQDYIRNHLGIRFSIDNRRSTTELGIAYRPIEQTLRDHYRAWQRLRHRR